VSKPKAKKTPEAKITARDEYEAARQARRAGDELAWNEAITRAHQLDAAEAADRG
jgi:hypothetical protein